MRVSKAQVSVEYLVITAFLLIVAGILFGYAFFSFTESSALAKADSAVTEVVNHANLVAGLGEGSTIFFEVDLPGNVQSFQVQGKSVNLVLGTVAGNSDIYGYAKANLTPATFSTNAGRKKFSAVFSDGNVVVGEVA